MMKPIVCQLFRYPFKSGQAESLAGSQADPSGFPFDRYLMAVQPDGQMISQREKPRLALVTAIVHPDGAISLQAPGVSQRLAQTEKAGAPVQVTLHGQTAWAIDKGEFAARWISEFLGRPARLVRVPDRQRRTIDYDLAPGATNELNFQDGAPFMLMNQASVIQINTWLAEAGKPPIFMSRFRPNIVVNGPLPFREDTWERIQIDQAIFRLVKPCRRCSVVNVNQETGQLGEGEPLAILEQRRLGVWRGQRHPYLGWNLIAEQPGIVNAGDPVEVLSTFTTPQIQFEAAR